MNPAEDPKPTDALTPPTPSSPAETPGAMDSQQIADGTLPTFEPSASLGNPPAAEQPSIGPSTVTLEVDGIPTPPAPGEASPLGLNALGTAAKGPEVLPTPPLDALHPALQGAHAETVDQATTDAEKANDRVAVLTELGQTLADPNKAKEIYEIVMKAHQNLAGTMPVVQTSQTAEASLPTLASITPPSAEMPNLASSLPSADVVPATPTDLPKAA